MSRTGAFIRFLFFGKASSLGPFTSLLGPFRCFFHEYYSHFMVSRPGLMI